MTMKERNNSLKIIDQGDIHKEININIEII